MVSNEITVALAGNPNVGKSTVFNALTGLRQHTGNWTGKTVEQASGQTKKDGKVINIVDIPGTYSLKPRSAEEAVAGEFIIFGDAQKVAVVCDATNLERNLYLVLQILETGAKTVVCVNLLDEARKKGIAINLPLLSKELGIEVVGVTAREGKGLNEFLDAVLSESREKPFCVKYGEALESACEMIIPLIRKADELTVNERWLALRLIERDKTVEEYIKNAEIPSEEKEQLFNTAELARAELDKKGVSEKTVEEYISSTLYSQAERIAKAVTVYERKSATEPKAEKIFTNRLSAYAVMLVILFGIFYITIIGANYPSQWLSLLFSRCEELLYSAAVNVGIGEFWRGMLIHGGFRVLGWVVSVMLPPMAIFFPCFTLLEDLGVLPRIAYVLDNGFSKAKTCGKQALTTCMGYGCNCVGISGARIIDSKRERLIAVITNALTPCNGRFPAIIKLISIFFVAGAGMGDGFLCALVLALVIVGSLALTLCLSNLLSRTLLKGEPSHYILELPPYRKPQVSKVIVNSVLNRTVFVLARAVAVAFPAGMVIWLLCNLMINDRSLLSYVSAFFEPLGKLMGLDGESLSAFFIGLPANEIVLPVALMSYAGAGEIVSVENITEISALLYKNGWTTLTAVCYIIFSVVHFPCATALITVYKETKSVKWTVVAFLVPCLLGILLCCAVNLFSKFFVYF